MKGYIVMKKSCFISKLSNGLRILMSIVLVTTLCSPILETLGATITTYEQISQITSGKYVLAMSGIEPTGQPLGQYAAKTSSPSSPSNIRDYVKFDATTNEANNGILWEVEEFESGHSIKAADVKGDSSYLNITKTDSSRADITLGSRQALNIELSSASKFTISKTTDGTKYYLRFTNSNGSGFYGGTNIASTEIIFFAPTETEQIDLPTQPTGEPLYTVAAISDLHTDYNIQNNAPYIRQGVINACNEIRENEKANVLLVAGDITSRNANNAWSKVIYERAIAKVYDTARTATASGRALYATGNHDFAVGGTAYNSGDYTNVMKNDTGEFEDVLYQSGSAHNHALAYHYVIDGMDFVVMNTPYSGGDNHSSYVFDQQSIDWVDDKLTEIGADKTVFVMGHYPLRDSRNISGADKGAAVTSNDSLKSVLLKYKNAVYLYGHDHGGAKIKTDTFERVTPYTNTGSVINSRTALPSGFVTGFVGSMGYYDGSLSAQQPSVVQALIVNVYSDRITFTMKNYGTGNAGSATPLSYSIPRHSTAADYKQSPKLDVLPVGSLIEEGTKLSDITFDGKTMSDMYGQAVSGTFAWKDGNTVVTDSGEYPFTFTPNDLTKYLTVSGRATLTVGYWAMFDIDGSGNVLHATVAKNSTLTKPTDPFRAGYTFVSWQLNGIDYDFSSNVVSNISLTAKWLINRYAVTFNSKGGSKVVAQTVDYNTVASKPKNPTRKGYIFKGWYKDSSCKNAYSFGAKITSNINIYAKWEKITGKITPNKKMVKKGKTLKLTAKGNTTIKSVAWKASNRRSVSIKVSGKGKVKCSVKGIKKGKKVNIIATITFKDGSKRKITRKITVK